jgi:7-cyano-7-deazaguanine reductase
MTDEKITINVPLHAGLKALEASNYANGELYKETQIVSNPYSLLERFPAPSGRIDLNEVNAEQGIHIRTSEFTSLCPITGQPDFATIDIVYTPNKWCVESKSLKLYLLSFRNRGHFHEAIINEICNDLAKLLNPSYLCVKGEFTPRGGIPIHPSSTFHGYGDEWIEPIDPLQVPLT